MGRKIPRRDFLNGVAVGVAGILSSGFLVRGSEVQVPPRDAATYPPARAGLRGNYPDAVSAFGPMGQGAYRQFPALDPGNDDTRDIYDLVIVGAGISGLAAAHLWRRALGANQKILILDNHDDFGGHAKRNEFTYQGRTFVGHAEHRVAVSVQLHR
jgi:spermidine dehydrogenase